MWLSLVERVVRDDEAEGSNPFTPTKNKKTVFYRLFCFSFVVGCEPLYEESRRGRRGNKLKMLRGSFFSAVSTAEQGATEVVTDNDRCDYANGEGRERFESFHSDQKQKDGFAAEKF